MYIGTLLETMTNNDNRNKSVVGNNLKPAVSITGTVIPKPKKDKGFMIDGRSRSSLKFHKILTTRRLSVIDKYAFTLYQSRYRVHILLSLRIQSNNILKVCIGD